MRVIIEGSAKEIAALAKEAQEQRRGLFRAPMCEEPIKTIIEAFRLTIGDIGQETRG